MKIASALRDHWKPWTKAFVIVYGAIFAFRLTRETWFLFFIPTILAGLFYGGWMAGRVYEREKWSIADRKRVE